MGYGVVKSVSKTACFLRHQRYCLEVNIKSSSTTYSDPLVLIGFLSLTLPHCTFYPSRLNLHSRVRGKEWEGKIPLEEHQGAIATAFQKPYPNFSRSVSEYSRIHLNNWEPTVLIFIEKVYSLASGILSPL